jgi:hypothetical protein
MTIPRIYDRLILYAPLATLCSLAGLVMTVSFREIGFLEYTMAFVLNTILLSLTWKALIVAYALILFILLAGEDFLDSYITIDDRRIVIYIIVMAANFVSFLALILSPIMMVFQVMVVLISSITLPMAVFMLEILDGQIDVQCRWKRVPERPQNIPNEELPNIEELKNLGHLKQLSLDCDWAMVEVTDEVLVRALSQKRKGTAIAPVMNPDDKEICVTAYTYDGTVSGIFLSGLVYQKVSGGKSLRPVLLFQAVFDDRDMSGLYKRKLPMSGLIRMGDCGSPVADPTTGNYYGHIISVSKDGKTAFVMSARSAFEAMQSEANMGPIIWAGLEPSSKRREHSLVGEKLVLAEPYM